MRMLLEFYDHDPEAQRFVRFSNFGSKSRLSVPHTILDVAAGR